jgi:hypothetical protein
MIQDLIPQTSSIIASVERLQKFICIHHNGESYVTWQKDADAAHTDCAERSQYGEPWRVLAYPAWI